MTNENANKCAHDMCQCATRGDEQYCSNHCRDAEDQDLTEIACDCGHSNCA